MALVSAREEEESLTHRAQCTGRLWLAGNDPLAGKPIADWPAFRLEVARAALRTEQ